ncbi:sigma-70 family RNA polymerase sigma factor [Bacillus sp. FJAT-49754]|uniref:Sigma-70 family RNA polymerase sigma factor n=2 Tax=Lederbergia citrea TaxID=2833581 RepID=A0A942UIQ8_9BACI|nr:sigma-70 family RNA polymerase sigma factor [Lederbergia citrea]MBS4221390.1 sigma-70 family RNA polymerase sigma factor [Lederbergia citrea]
MKKEIARLHRIIYGSTVPMIKWGVAQYGIEATMPKGSSGMSASELDAMDLREKRQIERLETYQRYVYALESAVDILENERQKFIYDCLLDEMTYRQIALHLNMSKDFVQKQKNDIVRQIRQSRQITAILTMEKSAV